MMWSLMNWWRLGTLDEDIDAHVAIVGVMESLNMVIMYEKVWKPHKWRHDDPWTLYDHWWCIWKWFISWNAYIWWFVSSLLLKPLIWWNIWSWFPHQLVMESYVMGLKSMESILFKYYMISFKNSLKPLHVVPWVLNHGEVWSYLCLYVFWDVHGDRDHEGSLICWRRLWNACSWWYGLWHPHVWGLWCPGHIEEFKGIRPRIYK